MTKRNNFIFFPFSAEAAFNKAASAGFKGILQLFLIF